MKPVAISAAAGLFPGAPTLEAYWERIAAARPAPLASLEERWGLPRQRYFSGDPADADRTYLDQAFCLDPSVFDAEPDEDRQERLGRIVVQRLLEKRGGGLVRERTGLVLATNFPGESYFQADAERYLQPFMDAPPVALAPASSPERLLRVLAEAGELGGPQLSVDTACSSSLYALELGIGLLESGRADSVVVCGLTGYLPLFLFVGFSRLRALSPTGQIRPFARDASGILLGEGCGAVLLERSAPAPLAWIRGLGLSSDGNDRSVFAPGADGQRLAYERAYEGLDPADTDYVEAHGTATAVGDATELETLHAFFGPRRSAPLPIGSVKSLVGHQLAAAGMAALLKGVLMLQAELLPPHLPVEPHPDLGVTCCELGRAATPWPRGERARRVGISAFGFGGSNAHLVLEEGGRVEQPSAAPSAAPPRSLVISDLEVISGCALDTASLAEAFERDEALQSAYSPERFGLYRDEVGGPTLGNFFPPRVTIEGRGLRMGPRLLARLDPFQLLLTHLSRRLLERHATLSERNQVGVAVLANVGGAAALQAYRRLLYLSHEAQAEASVRDFLSPQTSTERIASSLGTMCSGYPAFHLDLRAFHTTLSGPPGTLGEALGLAGELLGRRCQALLLGAGSLIKGPLELQAGSVPGEAAGFLLLEEAASAEARGAAPLARILGQAPSLPEALTLAQLEPAGLARSERVEVDPRAPLAPGAQSLCGHLGVATGLEALARLLLLGAPGQRVALEWREGEEVRGAVILEILRTPRPARAEPAQPLELAFLPAPRPRARGETGGAPRGQVFGAEVALQPGVLEAYLEETGAAICSVLRLQREALRSLQGEARSPGQVVAGQVGAGPALSAEVGGAGGVAVPPRAGSLGSPLIALEPAFVELYPSPAHRVLRDLEPLEQGAQAQLVIDEGHAYYFDHALDHAPGVLLVEALVQLCRTTLHARGEREVFVRDLQLSFRSFCEKAPARVELNERALGPGRWAFVGTITQGTRSVLSATIQLALTPPSPPHAEPEPWPGEPDSALVRKERPENVLSSRLVWEGGQTAACFVARGPGPGHALCEGGASHGPTFLLEVSRQAISQAFAVLEPEAFAGARVLLALRISLEAPVLRSEPLAGRVLRQPYVKVGGLRLGEVQVAFRSGERALGTLELKVQNVDPETYRRQREGSSS